MSTTFPEGSIFYDVDSKPVVELPDGECFAYPADGAPYPFPRLSSAFAMASVLTREAFTAWIDTGRDPWEELKPASQRP